MSDVPCDWPNTGCPTCADTGYACLTATQRQEVEAWAVSDLWEATGRVFGTCPVTVMPCQDSAVLCGACWGSLRSCGCGSVPEVKLPGPVASVTKVMVDGVELADTAYRIDDYQWLVRIDGQTWPGSADPLDPDSFSVTYDQGIPPPAGAGMVTGILACERAKQICGDKTCRLPRNVAQVTRQGVTMVRGASQDATSSRPWRYEANTISVFGLPEVDEWVRNAQATTRVGAVHSPDLPRVRRVTWEAATP